MRKLKEWEDHRSSAVISRCPDTMRHDCRGLPERETPGDFDYDEYGLPGCRLVPRASESQAGAFDVHGE
jgi:hypothetical protein